jgi:hypothetical protein
LIKNSKIYREGQQLEDYRSLLSLAAKNNLNHTVFKLKDEVPLKVVIRNLPKFLSPEEVKAELLDQGYSVSDVMQIITKEKKNVTTLNRYSAQR